MKPILFNTDMVRAILDGRKTVTRRVVKPQPKSHIAYACMGSGCGKWGYPGKDAWEYWDDERFRLPDGISQDELKRRWTPPCNTGDILYVRETWCSAYDGERYFYLSDKHTDREEKQLLDYNDVKWRPSIHMPKEAARIFLRVTDVRVERLQDIFKDPPGPKNQVVREGFRYGCDFIATWQNTMSRKDLPVYGWDANPWVWVIEFERVSKEAALKGGEG